MMMSSYMPAAKQLRWQAQDHRDYATRAKIPKRASAHLEIARILEAEADAIELERRPAIVPAQAAE